MADRYALFATAFLHDVQVDEVRVDAGERLDVGRQGRLRLPVPDDAPYVAQARWIASDRVEVLDGRGELHAIDPADRLTIRLGPVRLELSLVRQFALRRSSPFAWGGSLAWFVTVFAFTLFVAQIDVVYRNRCPWFGIDCPVPDTSVSGWNAEYLARLLREDYQGEDDGVVEQDTPRNQPSMPSGYLPAGDPYGPQTEMGGAEEVAPVPDRQPPVPSEALPPAPTKPERILEVEDDVGTPIEPPELPPDAPEGSGADPDGIEPEEPDDEEVAPTPPPTEEEEGFGLSDWMDMSPEDREIEVMLHIAKKRLRIDPDDPEALSLLAYYQYLAEDLQAAESTYDRIIAVDPESAAAYNNKALIYKRRKQYAKEEGLYRVALALEPDDTTAMNNLAVNLAHQGRYDEAIAMMDRLEVLLPGDPYSDLHRAKIFAEMGEEDRALAFLDKALAGMAQLDTLHHIEFRQDIRVDPSFAQLRANPRFRAILIKYYGANSPLVE